MALTFPLLLSGHWIVAAWAIQAVAMLYLGSRCGSRFLTTLALILYAVAAFDAAVMLRELTFIQADNYWPGMLDRLVSLGSCALAFAAGYFILKRGGGTDGHRPEVVGTNEPEPFGTELNGEIVNVFFWGAAIFGMSSCIALHSMVGHPGMTCITFLPWLLYFEQRINRGARYAVGLGIFTGLMFNQSLHYLTLVNCAVMAVLGLELSWRFRRQLRYWLLVTLAVCVAAALSGYRIMQTLDYLASFPREMEELLSIPVGTLIAGLIRPFVPITTPVVRSGRLGLQWHEIGSYVGILAVGFFLFSLVRERRWYHWGALIAVILILDSTSKFLPGYWLRQIPPFTSFFVITRWRFLLVFFLATGAAVGFARCLRQFPKYRKILLMVPILSCAAMAANLWHIYLANGEWMSEKSLLASYRQMPLQPRLVTVVAPEISYYVATRKNLDNLIGYEAVQGYFHHSH